MIILGIISMSCENQENDDFTKETSSWELQLINSTDEEISVDYLDNTSEVVYELDTVTVKIPAKSTLIVDYSDHITENTDSTWWIVFNYRIASSSNKMKSTKVYYEKSNTLYFQ